jgi:phospholipase/carboxylesterase
MQDPSQKMQVEVVQGPSLTYLTVYPLEYDPNLAYPVIFLLHGFGASMYDLADLCRLIDTRGYLYVCPNAPIPVKLEPGMVGFAWTEPGSNDPEQLITAEGKLSGFFQEVMENHGVSSGNSLLLGFSQGGSMTYRCGLSRPDLFVGLVALSCSMGNPDEVREKLPANRDQSIFISHGLRDNIQQAQSSREFLEAEGYTPSYNEYDMAHEISPDVISDLVPWIHRVLPPLQRNL